MASTSDSRPATPIRVPKAAGTYSTNTIDEGLRSEINTLLLQGGHIIKIQESLLHALHASPTNWPTLIHTHALNLLRAGECHTFPDLMTRVMADIKADATTAEAGAASTSSLTNGSSTSNGSGGTDGVNGVVNGKGKEKSKGRGEDGQSLALPKSVVEEGVRVTKECLEVVCEFSPSTA